VRRHGSHYRSRKSYNKVKVSSYEGAGYSLTRPYPRTDQPGGHLVILGTLISMRIKPWDIVRSWMTDYIRRVQSRRVRVRLCDKNTTNLVVG
jgi:hypothetical protein